MFGSLVASHSIKIVKESSVWLAHFLLVPGEGSQRPVSDPKYRGIIDRSVTGSRAEYDNIIGHSENLLFLTRYDYNHHLVVPFGQATNDPMNLPFGADVHSLGRLIKQKQLRLLADSPRKENLLLISAR